MSNHKNLVFFNKEGDYLNFNYNDTNDRFEGDILFHENSNDTFKTFGLYTLEKVPSFEYELPGTLTTKKFQLFNEFGVHFYGSKFKNQQIAKIEPVNNDQSFFSKWIYGVDFEKKFPIGTILVFDSSFLEFTNIDKTYVVVGSKKGAIMIISQIDNSTFEANFQSIYNDTNSYSGKTISGVNVIGIYDYVDSILFSDNLSTWNEPSFYSNYFKGKKLNIVNSKSNNGTVTIKNENVVDIPHFEYSVTDSDLPAGSDLIIEVITKTDLPKIYQGVINVNPDSTIQINSFDYPEILKPGREFKIVGTSLNDIFFTVDNIVNWSGISNETYFATQSQVIYNNKIYECILAYTQSFGSQSTFFINPDDTTYWSPNPTYVKVNQPTNTESIPNGQLYLTTDRYYFTYGWTVSSTVTLASAAGRYREELEIFNIDIYYNDDFNELKSDLIYPSEYAQVNYYYDSLGPSYSIGTSISKLENLVEVEEDLTYELNYDTSENFVYNIVFTDLDEYGLKIYLNGMVYEEEISWIYTGISVDMQRTIDKTLRNWISRNYVRLYTLGIIADLQYIGNFTSAFYNSIRIKTAYPNVPIRLDQVLVGTTANFYIEHSTVLFTNIGPYLNIKINDIDYGVTASYISNSNITDIPQTLQNWVDSHSERLLDFKIIVSNINSLLKFDFTDLDRRLDYSITTNQLNMPGLDGTIITRKIFGNHGTLIASNEVVLPGLGNSPNNNIIPGLTSSPTQSITSNFNTQGFSTGMVFSINNTMWPWVNQEFNIQYVDEGSLNLSYQGPFWGLSDSICNSSAFITIAFSNGFSATGCGGPFGPTGLGGPFDPDMFSSAFSIQYSPNNYTLNNYNLSIYPGSSNLVDIKYVQLSNSIYALGDGLIAMDAFTAQYLNTVNLPGLSQSIEIEFNNVNNYLYCLSTTLLYVIDPLFNTLVATMSLSGTGYDMQINESNGDVYVTYEDLPQVDIWMYNNFYSPITLYSSSINWVAGTTRCGKMTYDSFNAQVCITTDNDHVLRVNADRTIQISHNIPGLDYTFISYERVDNTVLVYDGNDLVRIQEFGNIQKILIPGQPFDLLFNNLSGNLNISDTSSNFSSIDLNTNSVSSNSAGNYGYLSLNQYDGDIYLSSQSLGSIVVISSNTNNVVHTESIFPQVTKIVYNPQRDSVWGIQPGSNSLVELEVELTGAIIPDTQPTQLVGDNLYGTLDPDYQPRQSIWLKSREYIRIPRENFSDDVPVKYYWKWITDDKPEFFLYDFSGDQLPTTGSYSYKGYKPLKEVVLNKKPNRDINRVYLPQYQQTIFDKIEYTLPYLDDVGNNAVKVKPLELFIGFKSEFEGAFQSTLQLFKKEEILFSIDSNSSTNITLEMIENSDRRGVIKINELSPEYFTNKSLKPGQLIVIYLEDISNNRDQYVSDNTASIFRIRNVYAKQIIVDFLTPTDFIINENTVISDYPKSGDTTYLKFTIKVADREIGRFNVYGQTEEEDERFRIELGNIGKLINPDEVFIFKEYDILEGGIDWKIMNRKRKEMLMMKHLIYPYIGSYKSIINAINYFGYNDLQLNEYYRNINPTSKNFSKLFKVEIPDIFDNTVEGWTENDFIRNTYPNENYEETNLFNLTYFITDKEGDNILNYSLDEIIIKLQGLKYWLKRNIIPLTHKILDITGVAYVKSNFSILHKLHDVRVFNIKENMTPISFKMNEAYLMPVNSGSTVYTCMIDFYTIIPGLGKEDYLFEKPKAFNNITLNLPDTYDIKIRTYKTYKEWEPFKIYAIGDKIKYYDKIYESVINGNRTNNPRKYESVRSWSINSTYSVTTVVEYDRDYYVYSGLGSTQSTSPNLDAQNWLKITEWKQIDFKPVQVLKEFRSGNNLNPFIFTVDSNVDPFITIEVTSDNGYGEIYSDRKNYELRGLNDLGAASVYQVSDLPKLSTNLVVISNQTTTTSTTTTTTSTTTTSTSTTTTTTVPTIDCSLIGNISIVYPVTSPLTILITLTQAGSNTGPFDIYTNYVNILTGNVDKNTLLNGYQTTIPDGTFNIRIQSDNNDCQNYIDLGIPAITTTTTTSTTTTSTTTTTTIAQYRNVLTRCSDNFTGQYLSPNSLNTNGRPLGVGQLPAQTRILSQVSETPEYYIVSGWSNNLDSLIELVGTVTNDSGCPSGVFRNLLQKCSDSSTNWYLSPNSLDTNSQPINDSQFPNGTRITDRDTIYIVIGSSDNLNGLTEVTGTVTNDTGCESSTTTTTTTLPPSNSHSIIWNTFVSCPNCDIASGTSDTVYTTSTVNNWVNGSTVIYTDNTLTTYYPSGRYIKYQGSIWLVGQSGVVTVECVVGGGC